MIAIAGGIILTVVFFMALGVLLTAWLAWLGGGSRRAYVPPPSPMQPRFSPEPKPVATWFGRMLAWVVVLPMLLAAAVFGIGSMLRGLVIGG
jgi:hypothetical protein